MQSFVGREGTMHFAERKAAVALVAFLWGGAALAADPDPATKAQTDALTLRQLQAAVDTAEANARKAQAEAEKAEREGKAAGVKAVAEALPNPSSGAVDVKANAGQLEAAVLATVAAKTVAPTISTKIRTAVSQVQPRTPAPPAPGCTVIGTPAARPAGQHAPVVIFSGTEIATFSHWEAFAILACQVEFLLKRANTAVDTRNTAVGGTIATSVTLGAAVSAATKLLAILTPNWEIGGVAVTQDDSVLVTYVAKNYVATPGYPLIWPARIAKLDAGRELVTAMSTLGLGADEARDYLDQLAEAKKVAADAKASAAEKADAAETVKIIGPEEGALTAATGAFDALASSLRGSDEKTALPLNLVVQQKALADALGTDGLAVWLRTQTANGGYYSRKLIWNAFGGMPFFVTGGVVVSYTVVQPSTWEVRAAGSYACHGGYHRLDRVAGGLGKLSANCTAD